MIVLSGASASGKTEVAKILASKYGITKVITTTTREKRIHEVDGKDYFFVSKEKFEEMLKKNEFVEYTIYNSNYYGSLKSQISSNKCIVTDPIGTKAYANLNDKNIVTFFLFSEEKTRFNRMLSRGDKKEDALKRIENDKKAFDASNFKDVNFTIDSENQTVDEVADQIYKIYKDYLKNIF